MIKLYHLSLRWYFEILLLVFHFLIEKVYLLFCLDFNVFVHIANWNWFFAKSATSWRYLLLSIQTIIVRKFQKLANFRNLRFNYRIIIFNFAFTSVCLATWFGSDYSVTERCLILLDHLPLRQTLRLCFNISCICFNLFAQPSIKILLSLILSKWFDLDGFLQNEHIVWCRQILVVILRWWHWFDSPMMVVSMPNRLVQILYLNFLYLILQFLYPSILFLYTR